jgi:hypothetical protein
MTEAADPANPWRSVRLGLLMFAVLLACLAAALLLAWQVIIPALGIDPYEGYSLIREPIPAAILVGSVLLFAMVVCYGGAIAGAWIARRYFTLNEIESEFLSILWLPGTRTANIRLFRLLFSRQADV